MSTIKAEQVLPFLRKYSDVTGIPGNTLEDDGVEEYCMPKNEMWTIYDDVVTQVNRQMIDDVLYIVFYVPNSDSGYEFEATKEINLDVLKRFSTTPLQFE